MRLLLPALGLVALVSSVGPAGANTIVFGTASFVGGCSQSGNSGDRSCTHTASVTNGALDANASVNVRGQASADHGITTNPTAIADITVTYEIPYTITRDVVITKRAVGSRPPTFDVTVPLQTLNFNATYSGSSAHDNSQLGGGLANAVAFTASLSSLGGEFATGNYAGSSNGGGGGPNSSNFTRTTPDPSYVTTLNFSPGGSAGEISVTGQIPLDYRAWTDNVAPWAEYEDDLGGVPITITQSFTDTLTISFRLRAESRPSGSISTTGGEAIACAGQSSPLGGFDLDPGVGGLNCGSGFTVAASTAVSGSSVFQVTPEPATALMVGGGLAALAWIGARRRREDS